MITWTGRRIGGRAPWLRSPCRLGGFSRGVGLVLVLAWGGGSARSATLAVPRSVDLAKWAASASVAGVTVVQAGQPADVVVREGASEWTLVARDASGKERTLPVPVPATASQREEVAVLAASLADGLSFLSVLTSTPQPDRPALAGSGTVVARPPRVASPSRPLGPSPEGLPVDPVAAPVVVLRPSPSGFGLPWVALDARVSTRSSSRTVLAPGVEVGFPLVPWAGLSLAMAWIPQRTVMEAFSPPSSGMTMASHTLPGEPAPDKDWSAWEGRIQFPVGRSWGRVRPLLAPSLGISHRTWGEPDDQNARQWIAVGGGKTGLQVALGETLSMGFDLRVERDLFTLVESVGPGPPAPADPWEAGVGVSLAARPGRRFTKP